MDFKLTKQQAEVADWAVGAAPEEDPDFMRDNSDLRYEDAPKNDGLILTIGSPEWGEDFIYRVTELWADVCEGYGWEDAIGIAKGNYQHADRIVEGWIRAGQNLGKKVERGLEGSSDRTRL